MIPPTKFAVKVAIPANFTHGCKQIFTNYYLCAHFSAQCLYANIELKQVTTTT